MLTIAGGIILAVLGLIAIVLILAVIFGMGMAVVHNKEARSALLAGITLVALLAWAFMSLANR